MESLKIILLCVVAAVIYGILHDQVTARVCVEYFTIGHPPIFNTESPTLLAFGWGTWATWWVGLILGLFAAPAARLGRWPKLTAASLRRLICVLMLTTGCFALLAGAAGFFLANAGTLRLFEPLASAVPAAKHAPFLADACAHLASYTVGFVGGLVLCGWIVLRRSKQTIS
jgi:hypothetical protein